MGNALNFNPSIFQLLPSTGLLSQKQGEIKLPNFITGIEKAEENSPDKSIQEKSPQPTTQSTYETKNVSLASKIKEIQSLLGKKTSSEGTQQLEFEFAYEKSEEFFFQFSQRTKSVENNLSSVQRETYAEIRQKISVQFKIGGSISGESMVGFRNASEKLFNDPDLFNSFMRIAQGLFANGDTDQWNEFFEGLTGLFSNTDGNTNAIDSFINRFLEQWLQKLFPDATIGNANNNESLTNSLSTKQSNQASFQFQFQMEFRFEMSMEIQIGVQRLDQQQDPIVFDLDGDGIELTDVNNGVRFDITGTGKSVQTAWVRGGDALLAWDRNGNGQIDSGLELFGDQRGSTNGFEELRKLDTNDDGFIGPEDTYFKELVLWRDNGDGISSQEELFTLPQLGIERIAVNYKNTNVIADGGNTITQKSFFIRSDQTVGRVADVRFNYTI